MYMCNRSLLPNNFLTFSLCINGITSIVGKCISFSFRMMWILSHLISNTSYIQFFLRVTLSNDNSPVNLNKCVFPVILFRSNKTWNFVPARNNFIFTMFEKSCPWKNTLFLIFLRSSTTAITRFTIIKIFSNSELQF